DEVRVIMAEYLTRTEVANLPYAAFETQATASWNTWEILVGAVEGAQSLDQQELCSYLTEYSAVTTINGHLTFDLADNHYWETNVGLKQIQDGKWVMVWPPERAVAEVVPPAN